jgi:hypothetical protein
MTAEANPKTMKPLLVTLTLVTSLQLAFAQERLTRDEALFYARAVSADTTQFQGTPIPTNVDLDQPVAMRDEDYGGLVLPQKGLTLETIATAGETPVPIGQLWLHRLAPMRQGGAVSRSALRLVTVRAQGAEETVPQCALAVRRNSSGALEMLVFGKGKEPVLTVPLKPLDARQSAPIDLAAERDYDSGRLTLKILGKHQATIAVTELAPY